MNSEKIMGLKNKIMGFFFFKSCIELEAVVLHSHPHESFYTVLTYDPQVGKNRNYIRCLVFTRENKGFMRQQLAFFKGN